MGNPNTVKLFEEEGRTYRQIHAYINQSGDLVMSAQDVGAAPEEFFDDSDYEFWATVKSADKDKVLLVLIEKLYGGHFRAVDEFRQFMDEKGIDCEFDTWY